VRPLSSPSPMATSMSVLGSASDESLNWFSPPDEESGDTACARHKNPSSAGFLFAGVPSFLPSRLTRGSSFFFFSAARAMRAEGTFPFSSLNDRAFLLLSFLLISLIPPDLSYAPSSFWRVMTPKKCPPYFSFFRLGPDGYTTRTNHRTPLDHRAFPLLRLFYRRFENIHQVFKTAPPLCDLVRSRRTRSFFLGLSSLILERVPSPPLTPP